MKKTLILASLLSISCIMMAQEAPEGLFINSKGPDFKVKDQSGNEIRLKDLVKKGKVVLVFYRGQWSVDCIRFLTKLQDSLQSIKDKGATVVAITPELPENIAKTIEKTKAEFSIIYDEELKIMKAYDVEFEVPENVLTRYHNSGIKVDENNGKKNGNFLPVPAVYVIDKELYVKYRFFQPDYHKRPSVKEILDNLK